MTIVEDIIFRIEKFAPPHLAEDWDPIGLSIGNRKQKVKKMMIALDLDANTLREAKEKEVDFIFTHHPAIFSPLKTLNADDSRRREYIELIRSNISLYSAHTNIDAAKNGMNDWLAEAIGLEKPYNIIDFSYEHSFKMLTIYGDETELTKVLHILEEMATEEMHKQNPIPYYSEIRSAVSTVDTGFTKEKLEVVLPDHLVRAVVSKLYEISSNQSLNFHLTPIEKKGKSYGIGRVGSLKEKVSIEQLIKQVKKAYAIPYVRTANIDLSKKVQRIAILGGSGEKYYQQALAQGADLYITGDIGYHGAQDMIREDLPFIDAGHYIENIFVTKMTELLTEWKTVDNWEIEIIPATTQRDVFTFK